MKNITIALVLKTKDLEYDDRVRKEILSIKDLYPNLNLYIYAMYDENVHREGITSYGISYETVSLLSRDKYQSAQKLLLKSYEFYKVLKKKLKQYDIIWCADIETYMILLLIRHKILLWDLHELPTALLKNRLRRCLLLYIYSKCRIILHANSYRLQYLKSLGLIKDVKKHYILRNYPDFNDVDECYDEKYEEFLQWKNDRKCVYLQGLTDASRSSYESIAAVLRVPFLVAIIVGEYDKKSYQKLKIEYDEDILKDRLFFIGQVAQLKIPKYVQQCYLSLVFYKNTGPNNWYCESNRLYQSILMGIPVVVGENPLMKELIDLYHFGVSIDDDGSNINKIEKGILNVLSNYEYLINNIKQNRNHLQWSSQNSIIDSFVTKLIK